MDIGFFIQIVQFNPFILYLKIVFSYLFNLLFYRLLEDRPGDEENLDNLGFEEISDEELEEEARANKGRWSTYYFCNYNLTTIPVPRISCPYSTLLPYLLHSYCGIYLTCLDLYIAFGDK